MSSAPLGEVEAAVRHALAAGDDGELRVLGYGEISLVVGWPADAPAWACKRLPVFADAAAADAYGEIFHCYLEVLRTRGVTPVESTFEMLGGRAGGEAGGETVGYVVQPVLPAGSLGPDVLRAAAPDPAHPLVRGVCERVVAVVDDKVGLDAQISNWALVADSGGAGDAGDGVGASQLRYLDVTTPMLFTADGHLELDLGVFIAAYPWLLRAPIRRFVAPGVAGAYRDPRNVLIDLAANLLKEQLEAWVPAVIEAANQVVSPAITEDEVRRYYRSDARLWEVMLRLRRADRWWQQHARRRTYPFLLPGPISR